jgi:hypothetical protein
LVSLGKKKKIKEAEEKKRKKSPLAIRYSTFRPS